MSPEERKKADQAARLKADQAAKEKADLEAKQKAEKEVEDKKKADQAAKEKADLEAKEKEATKPLSGNFIMKVTHLPWGLNGRNHFYAKKKPLINAKVMGKFHGTLKIWLANKWIEKGSYKD